MNYLDELNAAQRAAVEYNDGPQLVIAGAGSGKTRVLTYKIAYLLEHGVHAGNILALTFTNKAAREMKSRIANLVGEQVARYLWMGTFHSICTRILRQEAELIGYTRDFTIYDTTDSKSVIKHIVKDMQLDEKTYKPSVVLSRISLAKNQLLSPTSYSSNRDYTMQDRFARIPEVSRIYAEYNRRLKACNAMDFDDLLFMTNTLFKNHVEVLCKYQEFFRYILVDEYQDTNYSQYLIVKRLAEPENLICVVGDDAQSIYSFRGANIENILTFQKGYANAQLFKLERNYRSTQTIVNAANSLIRHNRGQIPKAVYSELALGDRLQLSTYMSDRDEGKAVAQQVKLLHRQGYDYESIAVLYRTNAQSRVIEDELRHLGIPYRIYGGMSFYQRKEIKDAIAYFRLAVNPHDNEAFARVINYPLRGIGDTTVMKVREAARLAACSMMEVICNPEAAKLDVSAATQKKFTAFAEMINGFSARVATTDAYEFASDVMRETGVLREAKADTTQEGKDRLENLEEMLAGIHEFVDQRLREDNAFVPMTEFLSEVSLLTDQDEKQEDNQPRITLLTVHAAKGLEFKVAFIVGLEENLFPSQFCQAPKEIEEERRLLYVAITRAMERCYLTNARQRFRNGQTQFSSPSRFLKDIDTCYVQQTQAMSSYTPQPLKVHTSTTSISSSSSSLSSNGKLKSVSKQVGSSTTKTRKEVRSEWKKQDRVVHKVFGAGTVLDVYHENDNDKIDIQFDNVGKKTLLLTYAKLTRE
ncbi:MAG: UvrD-helicase domain-containing protein [Paludibacteraceae bacterium]|nr:UvrD-helicase domain-containing protein [Paludibacteraceae bacterium]